MSGMTRMVAEVTRTDAAVMAEIVLITTITIEIEVIMKVAVTNAGTGSVYSLFLANEHCCNTT